jgi:periplasmic divalent cation tolerance protein
MVFIYTTCKDTTEAVRLGDMIIKGHLAACVNIWPIQSMLMEGDELKSQKEAAMIVKTIEKNLQPIEDLLEKNHAYTTPFVGAYDIRRINRKYKEWMQTVVR